MNLRLHFFTAKSLVILLGILTFIGCERATEQQCDRAFDHYFSLKLKGVPDVIQKVERAEFEQKRAAFLTRCVDETKVEVLHCWLKSETLVGLNECQRDVKMITER